MNIFSKIDERQNISWKIDFSFGKSFFFNKWNIYHNKLLFDSFVIKFFLWSVTLTNKNDISKDKTEKAKLIFFLNVVRMKLEKEMHWD